MKQLQSAHPWIMVRLENGDIAPFTGVHWYGDIKHWLNGDCWNYYTSLGTLNHREDDSVYRRSERHAGSPVTLIAHRATINNPEYAPHNEWGEVSP